MNTTINVFIFKLLLLAFGGLAAVYAVFLAVLFLKYYQKEKARNENLSIKDFFFNSKSVKKATRILNSIVIICFVGALCVACIGFNTLKQFTAGSSESWNSSFSNSLLQSKRFVFLPHLFLTDEELEYVQNYNTAANYQTPLAVGSADSVGSATLEPRFNGTDQYGLQFVDGISYTTLTYKNSAFYMITVADPTRVFAGLSSNYPGAGEFLEDMVKNNDALGGINAGSFIDKNGGGSGGDPDGITIIDGKCLNDFPSGDVAGLDENGHLYIGSYDYATCESFNLKYAVSFGPILISEGQQVDSSELEAGTNPRTAIGQRADGAIVLLCVDGRQAYSDGVAMKDVAEFLLMYDVVCAINMDGGSSTCMYYDGQLRNHPTTAMNGTRYIPTAWLIRK